MINNVINYNKTISHNYVNTNNSKKSIDMVEYKDEIALKEDKLLYECSNLKEQGIKFGSKEFKEYKKRLKGFPPTTAPGNVRRAFRKMMENLSEDERMTVFGMCTVIYTKMQNGNIKEPNSVEGYLDLCNVIKCKIENLSLYISESKHKILSRFFNEFKSELGKYN
jgi:hypothetical protein